MSVLHLLVLTSEYSLFLRTMSNNKLKNPEVALFRRMFSSANDEPDGLGLDLRWGVELRVASPKVQPHSSPSLALAQVKSLVSLCTK